jgi:hypothetical protein
MMGLEDCMQQAPDIGGIIDDENFWFHEAPPFSGDF